MIVVFKQRRASLFFWTIRCCKNNEEVGSFFSPNEDSVNAASAVFSHSQSCTKFHSHFSVSSVCPCLASYFPGGRVLFVCAAHTSHIFHLNFRSIRSSRKPNPTTTPDPTPNHPTEPPTHPTLQHPNTPIPDPTHRFFFFCKTKTKN